MENDTNKIDELVRRFSRVLCGAWPEVEEARRFSQTGSFETDWLQANWEMFVEGALRPGTFLVAYGEGADCNGATSRVYRPDAIPTHVVSCIARSSAGAVFDLLEQATVLLGPTGVPLDELVAHDGSWFERKPPFDCVLVEHEQKQRLFRLDDVTLRLTPVPSQDD